MESLVGSLPGAEQFLKAGTPWWFGFHAAPDVAESVLLGNEVEYIEFFLKIGTLGDGVTPSFPAAVVSASEGRDALRAAFEHYRALPESARVMSRNCFRLRATRQRPRRRSVRCHDRLGTWQTPRSEWWVS